MARDKTEALKTAFHARFLKKIKVMITVQNGLSHPAV
jgi:hypothetical protein